ncbi:MAG: hypothetical protein JNJ90_18820 [Saprospiraceae bacterium]|nr:hypothetical protein [Saprospiraceae bacterium]
METVKNIAVRIYGQLSGLESRAEGRRARDLKGAWEKGGYRNIVQVMIACKRAVVKGVKTGLAHDDLVGVLPGTPIHHEWVLHTGEIKYLKRLQGYGLVRAVYGFFNKTRSVTQCSCVLSYFRDFQRGRNILSRSGFNITKQKTNQDGRERKTFIHSADLL